MTIRRLAGRHRTLFVIGVLLGLCGAVASLAQPFAIGMLISSAQLKESLTGPVLLLIALFCADVTFSAGQAYLIGRGGENIVFEARRFVVGRLLRSDIAEFNERRPGDLLTRLVTDTSLVKSALSNSLAMMMINGFMVLGGVVLMLFIDVQLTLLTGLCLGIASGLSLWLARGVRHASLRNREDTGEFGADAQRALSALTTVKAARAEGREQHRVTGIARRARRSGIRVGALNALLTPTMNVGTQVSLAVVIGTGMARVATGSMPVAELTAFVMYLFYLVSPLVMLFMSIGHFQQGRAAIQRVDELGSLSQEEGRRSPVEYDHRGRLQDGVSTVDAVVSEHAAVEFRDVHFDYRDGTNVLSGVSFSIAPRGLFAVVGPSGAGKTTLFRLIDRLHSTYTGGIKLSGQDISTLPLDVVRGLVGYVQQESTAMRGTVRENLVYANPCASEVEIAEVLELAGLLDVVHQLPQGLESPLAEQGSNLSGGQLQRLCIARALLQKPAVLLLDEVTANLDSDSELALRRAIRRVSEDCAVIAIAHRISTVVDADRIIVLEDGRVRTTGIHDDLVMRDELYGRLASSQLGDGSERPVPGLARACDLLDSGTSTGRRAGATPVTNDPASPYR